MKDRKAVSYKLDADIASAMDNYCEESGLSKTAFIERAIAYYIRNHEVEVCDDIEYIKDQQMKRLESYSGRIEEARLSKA